MTLKLVWHKAQRLKLNPQQLYTCSGLDNLPTMSGIYVFGREFGESFEALYVGRTFGSLKTRISQQLNNAKLIAHIRDAPKGYRYIYAAAFKKTTSQDVRDSIKKIEKAYIRHFLFEGHDLANDHGTRLKVEEVIESSGKNIPGPKNMKIPSI